MRVTLVGAVAILMLAGCTSSPKKPITERALRSAFRDEGFHVVYTQRLVGLDDARFTRLVREGFGSFPISARSVQRQVQFLKGQRSAGLQEYVAGARGSGSIYAEIWASATGARRGAQQWAAQLRQQGRAFGFHSSVSIIAVRNVELFWDTYKASHDFLSRASSLRKRLAHTS
jgi:hypothetical protein